MFHVSLLCADVPLRIYSLTHCSKARTWCSFGDLQIRQILYRPTKFLYYIQLYFSTVTGIMHMRRSFRSRSFKVTEIGISWQLICTVIFVPLFICDSYRLNLNIFINMNFHWQAVLDDGSHDWTATTSTTSTSWATVHIRVSTAWNVLAFTRPFLYRSQVSDSCCSALASANATMSASLTDRAATFSSVAEDRLKDFDNRLGKPVLWLLL